MPKRPWTPYAVLCDTELLAFYATPQDVSTHFRSVDMTALAQGRFAGFFVAQSFVLASKYSCLAQTPCAKTAKSVAFCDSLPVFCGTELRFGSLCNLGLSKKLRFSLQRHKT